MTSFPEPPTDHEQLVTAATTGETPAIEELLVRHLPNLQAYVAKRANRLFQSKESVADLVQSVCREALEHIVGFQYQGERAFIAWLHKVALTKLITRDRYYRAKKRDVTREVRLPADRDGDESAQATLGDVYATFTTPSKLIEQEEQRQRLARAFDKLNDEQQEIIFLARIMGMSHADVAAQLGCSEEACRQRLRRAMARLALVAGADAGTSSEGSGSE